MCPIGPARPGARVAAAVLVLHALLAAALLRLGDIAGRCGVSRSHLANAFGNSPVGEGLNEIFNN